MALQIGIDSAKYRKYLCMVSGFDSNVHKIFTKIDDILSKNGNRGTSHFRKLSKRVKKNSKQEIYKVIKSCSSNKEDVGLNIYMYEHPRPRGVNKKDFYLYSIPNSMSRDIERCLKGQGFKVNISVDDDYNVSKHNGTQLFIENFLKLIGSRLVGKNVAVRNPKENLYRATIKHLNGQKMELYGEVANFKYSKITKLADLVMGFYLFARRNDADVKFDNIVCKKIEV